MLAFAGIACNFRRVAGMVDGHVGMDDADEPACPIWFVRMSGIRAWHARGNARVVLALRALRCYHGFSVDDSANNDGRSRWGFLIMPALSA